MLAKERHSRIVQDVNEAGFVSVRDLSQRYEVTEDCIRKDLRSLEDAHLLERIHGGAAAIRQNIHAYDALSRQDQNIEEKKIMAEKAVSLIHEQEVIYLDLSTTSLRIAEILAEQKRHVTVATNMIAILDALKKQDSVSLIFIGGALNATHDGFTGTLARQALSCLRFDQAFLGVVGVDLRPRSITTYDPDDAALKQAVLERAQASYMLCEHEKFQQEGHCVYAGPDDFSGIISDRLSEQEEKQLRQFGIRIV